MLWKVIYWPQKDRRSSKIKEMGTEMKRECMYTYCLRLLKVVNTWKIARNLQSFVFTCVRQILWTRSEYIFLCESECEKEWMWWNAHVMLNWKRKPLPFILPSRSFSPPPPTRKRSLVQYLSVYRESNIRLIWPLMDPQGYAYQYHIVLCGVVLVFSMLF